MLFFFTKSVIWLVYIYSSLSKRIRLVFCFHMNWWFHIFVILVNLPLAKETKIIAICKSNKKNRNCVIIISNYYLYVFNDILVIENNTRRKRKIYIHIYNTNHFYFIQLIKSFKINKNRIRSHTKVIDKNILKSFNIIDFRIHIVLWWSH